MYGHLVANNAYAHWRKFNRIIALKCDNSNSWQNPCENGDQSFSHILEVQYPFECSKLTFQYYKVHSDSVKICQTVCKHDTNLPLKKKTPKTSFF